MGDKSALKNLEGPALWWPVTPAGLPPFNSWGEADQKGTRLYYLISQNFSDPDLLPAFN